LDEPRQAVFAASCTTGHALLCLGATLQAVRYGAEEP
jgi:hypothetical protein